MLHIYLGSVSLQQCQSAAEVSGSPPLREHNSKIQPGSLLLSRNWKHSLTKILLTVVKPLKVKSVCWELCCADELAKRWLSCCASYRRQKGRKGCLPVTSASSSSTGGEGDGEGWQTAHPQHLIRNIFLLLTKLTQSIRSLSQFVLLPASTFKTNHIFPSAYTLVLHHI